MDDRKKRGLRPFGSLMPPIAITRCPEDGTASASESKPTNSATAASGTGPPTPIGTRHGGPGCATPTNSLPVTRGRLTALGPLRDPAALLPQRITSCLASTWTDGDCGSGWDGCVVRYELVAPLLEADMAAATEFADASLRPTRPERVLAELTRLRALTVSRDQSTGDLELIAAAFTDELRRYPEDVVVSVLREWPRTHRFWPSLAELMRLTDRIVKPREALRQALRQRYRQPEVSPDWIAPPSEADKAAVADLLAKHGLSADERSRVRPPETEPMTRETRRQVRDELAVFRLPPEDDPRVQARLREMGVA